MALVFRALMILACLAAPAAAQEAGVRFGGIKQDPSAPVEVTSETLTVDQNDGSAIFTGNVVVVQGDMRLNAKRVRVEYGQDGEGIEKVFASEDVLLVTPTDAAESDDAVYTIATGDVVMTNNVILTQGASVITGNKLTANLTSGTGLMTGNVKTVFKPGAKK